jgi:hypothetical protein
MTAALQWTRPQAGDGPAALIRAECVYHAVVGALITVAFTGRHVVRAAGLAEPAGRLDWEGSLHGFSVDFGEIPTARIPVSDISELGQLAGLAHLLLFDVMPGGSSGMLPAGRCLTASACPAFPDLHQAVTAAVPAGFLRLRLRYQAGDLR